MDTQRTLPRRRTSLFRRAGWLVIAALATVALVGPGAGIAAAASVAPIPISSGNPTCIDFAPTYGGGQSWVEYKVEPPANGTYSVGGGQTITISNFSNSSAGAPGSFDWSSNFGIDAVFVKAGSDKHNLYVYAPTAASLESFGDTGLGPQAGTGNGISHISFCWDTNNPPTEQPTE
ncbi:MAG: hypothetical protein MUC54_05755, partial [Chloroflexi bacterium]|nr:hypothetical protein [Chloroflexota bacterium]